jgi:hypothetical protein
MGDAMRIVGESGPATERELHAGRLSCPRCGGVLRPWGTARLRRIRLGALVHRAVRPRRARCAGCGTTHVLLPDWLLLRRAYAAPLIWAALAAHGRGVGYRRIAVRLRLPASTVRDWLRAFRRAAPALLARLGRLSGADRLTGADRLGGADRSGVAAIHLLERRSPPRPAWRYAVLVTGGLLLANTNPPRTAAAPASARPP